MLLLNRLNFQIISLTNRISSYILMMSVPGKKEIP